MTPDGPARRREIEDTTAARLAEVVAAAEQAAKQVIDEAEAEARDRLADATEEADRIVAERLERLVGLTEELDLHAETLKRGAEALRVALAEVRSELGGAESFGGSRVIRDADPAPEPPRPSAPERNGQPPRAAGPSLTVISGAEPVEPPPDAATGPDRGEPDAADRVAPPPAPSRGAPDFEPAFSGDTPAGARLLATQMAVSGSSREEIEQRLRSGFAIADTTSILDAILGPER